MSLHEIIFKYFWIMPIAGTLIQCFTMYRRSREHTIDNPNLAIGYRNYIINYAIYSLIPWAIIGIGFMTKNLTDFIDLIPFRSASPYTYAFFGVLIATAVIKSFWILFLNGAEFLEKHPGLFSDGKGGEMTAKQIKRRQLISVATSILSIGVVLYVFSKAEFSQLSF